jgi:hypothetical protein
MHRPQFDENNPRVYYQRRIAMPQRKVNRTTLKRLAGTELNALLYAKTIPDAIFRNSHITRRNTPIHDLNGQILFYRFIIVSPRNSAQVAHVDVAAGDYFGELLISINHGQAWNPDELLRKAEEVAKERFQETKFDRMRFVAYSMPKLAIQFLYQGEEQLMLELYTWEPVPYASQREPGAPPSNFERWSYIDETPAERKEYNARQFTERVEQWQQQLTPERLRLFRPEVLRPEAFEAAFIQIPIIRNSRELHYSQLNSDHDPCYEVRGQITNVWCVAASVQMLLDFYRYNYEQTRLASELGLGTINNPNGLPYSQDSMVVTVIELLTSNALDATMNTTPVWDEFVAEIMANRPLISFIPGHSRTVAGFTETSIFGWYLFRGLLVYDPWPPTSGVITRWENFGATTYRRTFTAQVHLI